MGLFVRAYAPLVVERIRTDGQFRISLSLLHKDMNL